MLSLIRLCDILALDPAHSLELRFLPKTKKFFTEHGGNRPTQSMCLSQLSEKFFKNIIY